MTTKSLKPSCFVYDESAYVSDAPLDFPVLINISNTHVDEDTPVTLRCHVTSGGNPPLFWSWYCGDMPMERGLSDLHSHQDVPPEGVLLSTKFNVRKDQIRQKISKEIHNPQK